MTGRSPGIVDFMAVAAEKILGSEKYEISGGFLKKLVAERGVSVVNLWCDVW
jgi:hypothetical protein